MFTRTPFGYTATLEIECGTLDINITKINESKDEISAFLRITLFSAGRKIGLFMGKFNFMSSRTRKELSNYLGRLNPLKQDSWQEIIERLSQEFIEQYYEIEPAVRIKPVEETHTEFLLYPIAPKGHPTLLYAPGGSGKSFLAMYISLLVKNGHGINGEVITPAEVLYCDWEMDINETQRRFTMLASNFEENITYPLYRRCVHPLQDELEGIMNDVSQNDVKLVVIDSAAPALGGDINNAEKVIQFFNCVRQIITLDTTVIILSHVSKEHKEKDEPMPVGSIFFENLSRMTWELKITYKDDGYNITLINRKTNFGKMPPVGVEISFLDGCAFVSTTPPEDTTTQGAQVDVVKNTIKYNKEIDIKTLAQVTGLSKDRLWNILTKLKNEGVVTNTGQGTWVYVAKEGEKY